MGTESATGALGVYGTLLPMLLFLVAIYFFLILPQKKQEKQRKALLDSLAVGDEIITIGGMVGKISFLDEKTVKIKVADDVEVKFMRSAVGRKFES